jgi:hypothetical protein
VIVYRATFTECQPALNKSPNKKGLIDECQIKTGEIDEMEKQANESSRCQRGI